MLGTKELAGFGDERYSSGKRASWMIQKMLERVFPGENGRDRIS